MKFEDYAIHVSPLPAAEGGGFMASIPDLPGCIADGATINEAISEARDAFAAWTMAEREDRGELPRPKTYSGQFLQRIPKTTQTKKHMDQAMLRELAELHDGFFSALGVDPVNGHVGSPYIKFATYPHVGSAYSTMQRRLVVVGQDIGSDETPGEIQTYDERRSQIEDKALRNHNPHMAGTCILAMHLLKGEYGGWERWLEKDLQATPKALLGAASDLPTPNPLTCIAFTNHHKFLVTNSGVKVQLDREREDEFLLNEIRILGAETVLLQGAGFRHDAELLGRLATVAQVFVGDHPSVRGTRRKTANLIESVWQWPHDADSLATGGHT